MAIVAVLAGVSEELLFRGVLQTAHRSVDDAVWSASPLPAWCSVACMRFRSMYFILATLIGVYLGWLLLKFDDLTVPIVAHGLYDFVALVYLTSNRESDTSP